MTSMELLMAIGQVRDDFIQDIFMPMEEPKACQKRSFPRTLLIAAVILVSGLGFNGIGGLTFTFGSNSLTLTGLAIAAILGILLNAILPGKDYQFGSDLQGDTSVTFQSNMKK